MLLDTQINDDVLKRFIMLDKKGCLAHAYLFIGQREIGKKETALCISKFLNCENKDKGMFCDTCHSCAKINSGNHPDIHLTLNEYGQTIKIEQIREVLSQEQLRPFMSKNKIFILTNVENLTLEAANSLLKTLEEPSSNSLLILTTSLPQKVLETIKSRCHFVYFAPFSDRTFKSRMERHFKGEDIDSQFLSYFSRGCFGRARKLKEDGIFIKKDRVIDDFLLSDNSEALLKETLEDKGTTKELLDVILTWIRDAILVKSGVEDKRLVHIKRVNDLKKFQGRFSFDELNNIFEEIVNVNKLLSENLNVKISLLIVKERLWEK